MNWNWACEQLLKGEKVRRTMWNKGIYNYLSPITLHIMAHWDNNEETYAKFSKNKIESTDWELYEEPKKWTEEDIRKAKAGIELGLEWIARDKSRQLGMFGEEKPHKALETVWRNESNYYANLGTNGFNLVRWEDKEPTLLQDIVDSEVEE